MRLLSIRQAWAEMNILDRGWIAQPVITIACRSLDFILADAPRTSVAYSVSAGANFRSLVRYRIPIASGPRLRKFRGILYRCSGEARHLHPSTCAGSEHRVRGDAPVACGRAEAVSRAR